MIALIIIGVVLIVIAIVRYIQAVGADGASLIGFVVVETIAIPIAVAGAVLIIAGVLWK